MASNMVESPSDHPACAISERLAKEFTKVTRALKTLGAGSHTVLRAIDGQAALREMCRVVVETGGYRIAFVAYAVRDERRSVRWMVGALVPAAVMSIGAANLFTRKFWKPYINPADTPAGDAKVAKLVSLVVKVGALVFIVFLPTKFALDLQLLGGVWILQTFPVVVFGLLPRWFGPRALLAGPSSRCILW